MTSTVKIPEGWIETTLGELVKSGEINIKNNLRQPISSNVRATIHGIYPYYGAASAIDYLDHYSVEGYHLLMAEDGTVTIDGKHPMLQLVDGLFNVSNHAHILQGKDKKKTKLLFYILSNVDISAFITGAVQPKLSKENLFKISFLYPSKDELEKIVDILSSFDDKIELLKAENQTLEEMGQTLFKKWFGKYKVEDELPDGWKIGKLGDYCETVLGGTPSREKNEYWGGDIPWINSGKVNESRIIEASEYITEEGLNKSATKLMPKGTVVIAITGATLGQYSMLCIDSCFNQSVVGIKENNKFRKEFLYYFIGLTIKDLINNQTGGAQQHINKQVVDNHDIIVPTDDILEKYYKTIEPIFNKITENLFQIENLSKSREQLLPKLMSGEVRVEF